MATLTKCVNGHYYDADKSKDCPYCRKQEEEQRRISRTLPIRPNGPGTWQEDGPTVSMPVPGEVKLDRGTYAKPRGRRGIPAGEEGVTIGIYSPQMGTAYVTGWLVGVEGPVKGRDYRISHGRNSVGCSHQSDICISEGTGIAENGHCIVVYDGRGNQFYLAPGNGTITYRNGELLREPVELSLGDRIGIGDCTFEFVPFCREGHVWEVEES